MKLWIWILLSLVIGGLIGWFIATNQPKKSLTIAPVTVNPPAAAGS